MSRRSVQYLLEGLNQVEGWLSPTTAQMMMSLVEEQTKLGIRGDLAEIGVHHGKSFLALATAMTPDEKIFAIDVFDDQHKNVDQSGRGDRQAFLDSVNVYAPGTALEVIQESSLDLPAVGWPQCHANSIRFFSIDGSHTREATLNDLRIAEQTTKEGAIVAVDDIFNAHWLGVISGVSDYLSSGGALIPFALVPNKMLLARDLRSKDTWRDFIRGQWERHISKHDVKFFGYPVDIVDENVLILEEVKAAANGNPEVANLRPSIALADVMAAVHSPGAPVRRPLDDVAGSQRGSGHGPRDEAEAPASALPR